MWGNRRGIACIAAGVDPYVNEGGTYRHREWAQDFRHWPEDRKEIVSILLDVADDGDDAYVAPLLRGSRSRRKGNGVPGSYLYADCDKERTADEQQLLDRLLYDDDDAFEVLSGSGGHTHLYVPLVEELPVETFTTLNRRLAVAVNADGKWSDDTVLRLPGTLNHKSRVRGGEPAPVRIGDW